MYNPTTISLLKIKEPKNIQLKQPKEVYDLVKDISSLAQEVMQVITLNTQYNMIDRHLVSLGILNQTLTHPREIFRPAIQDAAEAIILVHNHPSGDPTPSDPDLHITRELIKAGQIIKINILDHIIIGSKDNINSYFSMQESGIIEFS